jgi:hypothetical protein
VGAAGGLGHSMNGLATAMTAFLTRAYALANALQNLNHLQLTVEGKQTVEMILNGAGVLASITPQIQEMIKEKTAEAIRGTLRRHLPDAGVD